MARSTDTTQQRSRHASSGAAARTERATNGRARDRRRGGRALLRAASLAAVVLLAAAVYGTTAASGRTGAAAASDLTVVVFHSFSGANAAYGPESLDPCLAAVDLINAHGGVLGHDLKCQAADSRGDPADAVPAATKVVATVKNIVGILGPGTNTAPPTVPIFNAAHIPMFSTTGSSQYDRQTKYDYFWRMLPPDEDTGYALAIGLHDAGIHRIASVFGDAATNQTNVGPLVTGFTKLGGQVVVKLNLHLGQSSYETEAARVAAKHPQAVATEADPQTDATFLSQLRQQMGGKLPPIYGTSATQEPDWLTAVGKALGPKQLASLQYVAVPYAPFSGPVYTSFKKALLATHASKPVQFSTDIFSLSAFDAVNIMALCMIQTSSTTPATYNKCVRPLTAPSKSATVVHTFAAGKAALAKGKKIRYVGVTGSVVLNKYHSSPGEFAIVKYTSAGANGKVAVVRLIPTAEISKLATK